MHHVIKIISYGLLTIMLASCGGETKSNPDTIPPDISLNGESLIILSQNRSYHEVGATAIDNVDGNLPVTISNNICNDIPGIYSVTYTATDTSGNRTVKTRKVKVMEIHPSNTYSPPSHFQKYHLTLDSKPMPAIDIHIDSSYPLIPAKDQWIRANDIYLGQKDNSTILYNNSYIDIKNLIGRYTDKQQQVHLVKLTFDRIIKAHTAYVLKDFLHADTMHIYQTSQLFNQAIKFAGDVCDASVDNTDKVKYCFPTPKEQTNYELLLANLHYFYNSIDGLASFVAWKNKTSYRSIDISSSYRDFPEMKQSNLWHSFLKATLPNNQIALKSTRYIKNNTGVGSGGTVSLLGIKENQGWISLWKDYLRLSPEEIQNNQHIYTLIHHELMHGCGFTHTSGMPIGFSNALGEILTKRYAYDRVPVFEIPKYVFNIQFQNDKQMKLSVYHTSETYEDSLILELLSVEEMSTKLLPSKEGDHLILETALQPSMRFFLRLYGADSDRVMSKLLYPFSFAKKTEGIKTKRKHYLIPAKNWQFLSKYNTENLYFTPKDSEAFCKAWTGDYTAKTASLSDIEINESETPFLVHSPHSAKLYYILSNEEDLEINNNHTVKNRHTAILCKVK